MPTIELNEDEQAEWTTTGDASIIGGMLSNVFLFLKEQISPEHLSLKKKFKHILTRSPKGESAQGEDDQELSVEEFYERILTNINNTFNPNGTARLSGSLKEGRPMDCSALLGAYFRSKLTYTDGSSVVKLTQEQLDAVYNFVQPLVDQINKEKHNEGMTPEIYLQSFEKSPRDNHALVIFELIFNGIPKEQRKAIFDEQSDNAKNAEALLHLTLNIVEFMRTPLRVLVAETQATEGQAKHSQGASPISAVDQQWTQLMSSIQIQLKKFSDKTKEPSLARGNILELIPKFQRCFGVENTRLTVMGERNEFLLGEGATDESVAEYVDGLRAEVLEIHKATISAEDVQKIPVGGLVDTIRRRWDELYQSERTAKEQAVAENETLQASLSEAQSRIEKLEGDLSSLNQAVTEYKAELEKRPMEVALPPIDLEQPSELKPDLPGVNEAKAAVMALAVFGEKDKRLSDHCLKILDQLAAAQDTQTIQTLSQEIKTLTAVSTAIKSIVKTLEADDIVSHSGRDKAGKIEQALSEMAIEDRLKLVTSQGKALGPEAAFPQSKALIEALSIQRSRIFKREQSASLRMFNTEMERESSPQKLAEDPAPP